MGIVRDLPHDLVGLSGAKDTLGLVARADPAGGGEVLTNTPGYERVDPSNLPLGATTNTVVSLLKNFALVDDVTGQPSGSEDTQGLAVVTMPSLASPTTGETRLYRLDPTSTNWTNIPFTTGTGSAIAGDEGSATVDGDATTSGGRPAPVSVLSMVDGVVFARGAPGTGDRQTLSTDQANNGQITQPVFIWTNNLDPVFVYPRASNTLEYEPLTDQLGTVADPCDFRCVSVEVFGDRVNFLNTAEATGATIVRHRNRLRRTARGTCDPDPTFVGAGFTDLDEFAGHGVKLKKLSNVMAAYFQDGVAFVRETGQVTAPYGFQILDDRRRLLSTHGLVSISNSEHFGVFDDGWFILDASGRWREVGVVSIDGRPIEKWKRFFYTNFDQGISHRLQLHYDAVHNWILMAVPEPNQSDVVREWIYEIDTERVWRDTHPGVTTYGDITIRGDAALIWSAAVPTWSTVTGSWISFGSEAGNLGLVHGTQDGLVHFRSENFYLKDGANPSWSYASVPSDFGRPLSLKTGERVSMEHIDLSSTDSVTLNVTSGKGGSDGETKALTQGSNGSVILAQGWGLLTDEALGAEASGTGPVQIRSLSLDMQENQVERVTSGT